MPMPPQGQRQSGLKFAEIENESITSVLDQPVASLLQTADWTDPAAASASTAAAEQKPMLEARSLIRIALVFYFGARDALISIPKFGANVLK
jgi:hypothetical protein